KVFSLVDELGKRRSHQLPVQNFLGQQLEVLSAQTVKLKLELPHSRVDASQPLALQTQQVIFVRLAGESLLQLQVLFDELL
ncbi:hypothetical protein NP569_26995, partial [Vibrio parahaemolyticus]|nr:hypothetical protein [Vibrio parahaemolyticus]